MPYDWVNVKKWGRVAMLGKSTRLAAGRRGMDFFRVGIAIMPETEHHRKNRVSNLLLDLV